MFIAALGIVGMWTSKVTFGRVLLRLYSVIIFLTMIVFFTVGGVLVYANKEKFNLVRVDHAAKGSTAVCALEWVCSGGDISMCRDVEQGNLKAKHARCS